MMYYKNKNNLFLVRKNKLSNKKIKAHKLKKMVLDICISFALKNILIFYLCI